MLYLESTRSFEFEQCAAESTWQMELFWSGLVVSTFRIKEGRVIDAVTELPPPTQIKRLEHV